MVHCSQILQPLTDGLSKNPQTSNVVHSGVALTSETLTSAATF